GSLGHASSRKTCLRPQSRWARIVARLHPGLWQRPPGQRGLGDQSIRPRRGRIHNAIRNRCLEAVTRTPPGEPEHPLPWHGGRTPRPYPEGDAHENTCRRGTTVMTPEIATPMLRMLAERWWAPVIRGVAAILFGILCFASPSISLLALVVLF